MKNTAVNIQTDLNAFELLGGKKKKKKGTSLASSPSPNCIKILSTQHPPYSSTEGYH